MGESLGTKQRARTHLMESASGRTFEAVLPQQWVLRHYKPDYGLDLAVEVFEPIEGTHASETLGEHFFVQLKSTAKPALRRVELVHAQEPAVAVPAPSPHRTTIDAVALSLETSELRTVEVMGSGAVVLLVLVDLTGGATYFVCLNDYIDKVLSEANPAWRAQQSSLLLLPTRNRLIGGNRQSLSPIRFYAKRAKFLAAFQRFNLDAHELGWWMADVRRASSTGDAREENSAVVDLCRFTLRRCDSILRWDFWQHESIWPLVYDSAQRLRHIRQLLLEWGEPFSAASVPRALLLSKESGWQLSPEFVDRLNDFALRDLALSRVDEVWRMLANLPRIYEEVCRRWFLPLHDGYALSDLG